MSVICLVCGDPEWVACAPGTLRDDSENDSGPQIPANRERVWCLRCWPFSQLEGVADAIVSR